MKSIKRDDLKGLFESISNEMTARKDELCEMDALLGDGDLGLTMSKGFADLPSYIESLDEERVGKCISKCGMRFSGVIPSTMGFLLGSGFMNGGKAIGEAAEITAKEFSAFLGGFAEGIKKRGKCEVGDRTVLDSINTAYEYSKKAFDDNNDISLEEIAKKAYEGALKGLEDTKNMTPKFGKSAVHKDNAAGREDQGAKAGMYLIKAMCEYINKP